MNTEELIVELHDINYIPGYKETELQRITNEEERKNAETTRILNEQTRETNELEREANEKTRKSNETTRKSSETTRQTNEATREANEKIRQSNELYREEFIGNFEGSFDITIPKGIATGSPIKIEDALPYKILELEVEGNSYQEENPTPDNPKEITVIEGNLSLENEGENLLDFDDFLNYGNAKYTKKDSLYSITDIGSVVTKRYPLNLKPNTTYTLSCDVQNQNSSSVRVQIYKDTVALGGAYASNGTSVTFTTEEGSNYTLNMTYSGTLSLPILYKGPQLVNGTIAREYKPYREGIITEIDLQDKFLAKLPNGTKDRLYLENGRLYLEQNVGKVVLNGSENWAKVGDRYYLTSANYKNNVLVSAVSNKLLGSTYEELFHNNGTKYLVALSNGTTGGLNRLYISTNIEETNITDVNTLKIWLSENNVTVYYELVTPVIHDLGNCAIETFEGINNIFLNANLDTNMSVKYALDIKKYTDKKLSDITNALISLGANI